jgi:hypothetical protein
MTPDELRAALRDREDAAIAKLCAEARQIGLGAISATTIATGRKALDIAQRIQAADSITTGAAEMRSLRIDPAVNAAIEKDLAAFANYLDDAIQGWMEAGWLMQAEGQADIIEAEGGPPAKVRLGRDDRAELALYNIMGHTKAEQVGWLVSVLRHDIGGALGLCLITTAGDAVLGQLGVAAAQNASRLEQQARQAFLAGTGAARDEMIRALAGSVKLNPARTCNNCNTPMDEDQHHCHDCNEVHGHQVIIADVPYAAGTSHDGLVVYIDRRIPHFITIEGVEVDLWEAIAIHELFEDPLLDAGLVYADAHAKAEDHEEEFIREKYKISGKIYRAEIQKFVDLALEKATDKALIPADLEQKPYADSDEMWRIIGAAGVYREAA